MNILMSELFIDKKVSEADKFSQIFWNFIS